MSRSVRIGHMALSFHEARAIEVEKILTVHGHAVERSAAPHEEMFSEWHEVQMTA
jgi:glycine betaine/proline transport system substrate-binding protein